MLSQHYTNNDVFWHAEEWKQTSKQAANKLHLRKTDKQNSKYHNSEKKYNKQKHDTTWPNKASALTTHLSVLSHKCRQF